MKRSFEFITAVLGIVALSPILLAVAALIKGGSDGPVFYRGMRVGLDGKAFRIFKFRTMVFNADKIGGSSTADGDSRVTSIGRILRKYKLDELPQLLNVLAGDMSFVGPRPQVEEDVAKYTDKERAILSVRPGITDWSSIRFRDEGAILAGHRDPDQAYVDLIRPEKIRLQLLYVREMSFCTDLKILWATGVALLGGEVKLP